MATTQRMQRLKSRKLIEQLFTQGRSFAAFPLRAYYLFVENGTAIIPLQTGFGASTKNFRRAVDRNRIKRLMREAYRLQQNDLALALQQKTQQIAVFFIYTGKELPDLVSISAKMTVIVQRLIKMIHESPAAHT